MVRKTNTLPQFLFINQSAEMQNIASFLTGLYSAFWSFCSHLYVLKYVINEMKGNDPGVGFICRVVLHVIDYSVAIVIRV